MPIMHPKNNWKGNLIKAISTYRTWYDKGIQVLAVVRNMEFKDIAILMAAVKFFFGDVLADSTIIILGGCYWVFNAIVNTVVGMFWEKNDGWKIEAEVFGKRNAVGRTVLVSPEGDSYDARQVHIPIDTSTKDKETAK
jgi:hypothetical protein